MEKHENVGGPLYVPHNKIVDLCSKAQKSQWRHPELKITVGAADITSRLVSSHSLNRMRQKLDVVVLCCWPFISHNRSSVDPFRRARDCLRWSLVVISKMTKATLLLVVGEPFDEAQKTLILDRIIEGSCTDLVLFHGLVLFHYTFFFKSGRVDALVGRPRLYQVVFVDDITSFYVTCIVTECNYKV